MSQHQVGRSFAARFQTDSLPRAEAWQRKFLVTRSSMWQLSMSCPDSVSLQSKEVQSNSAVLSVTAVNSEQLVVAETHLCSRGGGCSCCPRRQQCVAINKPAALKIGAECPRCSDSLWTWCHLDRLLSGFTRQQTPLCLR